MLDSRSRNEGSLGCYKSRHRSSPRRRDITGRSHLSPACRRFSQIAAFIFFAAVPALAQYAYVGGSGLAIIDTATNKVISNLPPGNAAVTSDGAKVYAVDTLGNAISVVDPSGSQATKSIPVGMRPFWIAFTPDNRTAYVTLSGEKTITVIDAGSDSVTTTIPLPAIATGIAASPDGSKVYATVGAGSTDGYVLVIPTSSNTIARTIPLPSPNTALIDPLGLDFSPDGTRAYVADNRQGYLFIIDIASDSVLTKVKIASIVSNVAISPDGAKAYICNFSNLVSVMRTSDNTILSTIALGGNPQGLSFTPNGAKLYVANRGLGSVQVIDTATDTLTATINTDNQPSGYGVFIQRKPSAVLPGPPTIASAANGFSGTTSVAPGSLISLYGTNLATGTASFSSTLPTSLLGTSVLLGTISIPLYYVSPGQINAQIPPNTAPGATKLVVAVGGLVDPTAATFPINILPAAPGIPFYSLNGVNHASLRNQDNSVNTPTNPATTQSAITIYLTGIGPVDNAVPAGQPAPNSPLSRATLPVQVTIGGQPVTPTFSGLTPGSIGLAQVNVTVPSLLPGDYPIIVTVNGTASNAPVISVR